MKITITLNQEVQGNSDYITCAEGDFYPDEFVLCKSKHDVNGANCMFLAGSIVYTDYEGQL